ncbi:MAG TPA: hypothetical protein PKU84_14040 [Spirochaetota bacterium]|nr:hypothetical protein [Spirochaetota bacterium]
MNTNKIPRSTNVTVDTVMTARVKEICNEHLEFLLMNALQEPDGKKRTLNIKIELASGETDKVATKVSVKSKLPDADADEVPGILDFTGQGNLFLVM